VLQVQIIGAQRAAEVLRGLFPRDRISVDRAANAIVVVAPPDDVAAMRGVLQGLDVRGPLRATSDAVQLHTADPAAVANRLRRLYRGARIEPAPNRTLLIKATPGDLAQIKALIAAIDTPLATPSPAAAPVEAVRVTKASPRDVARAIANQFRGVRASVAGQSVVLGGAPDEVARAKALIALIDQPRAGVRYTQIYRLRYVDAHSVGDLIARSFHDAQITTDASLNALSVLATQEQHQRIADALAQLDASGTAALAPGGPPVLQPGGSEGALGGGNGGIEVVSLRAAAPGLNGAPSSSATDIATTVTQAMQGQAPDLRITVPPNGTQLVLTGSPYAIRQAKALIDQLDVEQKLVVLDTEILEVDETAAKNLGLSFTSPTVGTTFTETTPASPDLGTPPPFISFQPLTRTPVSFGITLNLLVQSGKGRVLADPRITTISGRTATIRAGDNIAILTTTGGGTGTVATTQLQTFQTGVTLDITPVVNAGNFITVALHPTVNSLAGIANGIPQIATRDTQTTVAMREDETLVIGGLIQDTTTRNETKIPLLGDLPLLGRAFRNEELNHQRNELIITVTPHIVTPGSQSTVWPGPALPALPTAAPLPTLPPGTTMPPRSRPRAASPPAPTPPPVQPAPSASAAKPPARGTSAPAAQNGAPSAAGSPGAANATPPPDTFAFGQAPASNAAGPNDPVRIYALTFAPTTVRSGTPVRFTAITSANATKLTIGYPGFETSIAPTAPGRWMSAYNFSAAGLAPGPARLTVTASRADGAATSAQIPITVVP
jgi:type II secretory pathway component GspD/PulD (secretin)